MPRLLADIELAACRERAAGGSRGPPLTGCERTTEIGYQMHRLLRRFTHNPRCVNVIGFDKLSYSDISRRSGFFKIKSIARMDFRILSSEFFEFKLLF